LRTPVLFLIFNRPAYTERVFERIAAARPSKLLVVADGPRSADEADLCRETRDIVARVDWDCEVIPNYSEANMGCRARVSSGIDWAFSLVEEAIILEDDCLPAASFFSFCELMLDRYRDDKRVMMVSGTNFLRDQLDIPESYTFSQYPSIWGWATWRRAWQLYDVNMEQWPVVRDQRQLERLVRNERVSAFYSAVWNDTSTINSTWDYQWSFARRFNHGLGAVPRVNLVSNIGTTGATHGAGDTRLGAPTFDLDTSNLIHPRSVFPDQRLDAILTEGDLLFGPAPNSEQPTLPSPIWLRAARRVKRLVTQPLSRHPDPGS